MNRESQIRKAIREMMKGNRSSNQPTPIHGIPLAEAFHMLFNQDAKDLFKRQATSLVHEYNEPNDPKAHMWGLMELIGLLGIKSAEINPCNGFWNRQAVPVKFFGQTCTVNEVIPAIHKMVEAINDMASKKWMQASLYNLGMMELVIGPNDPNKKFIIFSYLAPKGQHEKDVEAVYGHLLFPEGGIPPEFK